MAKKKVENYSGLVNSLAERMRRYASGTSERETSEGFRPYLNVPSNTDLSILYTDRGTRAITKFARPFKGLQENKLREVAGKLSDRKRAGPGNAVSKVSEAGLFEDSTFSATVHNEASGATGDFSYHLYGGSTSSQEGTCCLFESRDRDSEKKLIFFATR